MHSSSSSSPEEGELVEAGGEAENLRGQQQRFDILRTTSRRDLLCANGYEYHYEADSRTDPGIEYWKCVRRRPYCPGRIHVDAAVRVDDEGVSYKMGVVSNATHNHPPVHSSVRRGQMQLRQSAAAENAPSTRQAIDNVRSNIPAGIRATQAASSSSMGRSYRNYVAQARENVGDDLLDSPGVIIPERLLPITSFDGHVEGQRIIVFMTQFGRNLIQNYGSNIAMDGTFKVAPIPFNQLYNVCVLVDYVAIPVVYALLQAKSTAQYTQILTSIRQILPNWQPLTVMSDFERAAMEVCRLWCSPVGSR